MIENELIGPSKLDLIERIVKKSEVHENEIDGKCVFISLEHINYLIKATRNISNSLKGLRETRDIEKNEYREGLKNIVLAIEEEDYENAELIALELIGEW